MLVGILNKLNKAVHEALSAESSKGAHVAQEATEAIHIIDKVASHALASAFESQIVLMIVTQGKSAILSLKILEKNMSART